MQYLLPAYGLQAGQEYRHNMRCLSGSMPNWAVLIASGARSGKRTSLFRDPLTPVGRTFRAGNDSSEYLA